MATATFKLGRAVQLAAESGNDGTMKLLQAVVDVDDPATGTVRLQRDVATSTRCRSTPARRRPCGWVPARHDRRLPERPRVPGDRLLRSVRGAVIAPAAHGSHRSAPGVEEVDTSPAAGASRARLAGRPRPGDDRYCESCGYDFAGPPRPRSVGRRSSPPTAPSSNASRSTASRSRPTTQSGGSRSPMARTGSGGAAGTRTSRRPRSTWRRHPRTPASHACTRCSSGAATGSSSCATSARRTAPWSTTTRRRSLRRLAIPLADGDRVRVGRVDDDHVAQAPAVRRRLELVRREQARARARSRPAAGASRSGAGCRARSGRTGLACAPSPRRRSGAPRRRSAGWSPAWLCSTPLSGGTGRSAPCAWSRSAESTRGSPGARAVDRCPRRSAGSR